MRLFSLSNIKIPSVAVCGSKATYRVAMPLARPRGDKPQAGTKLKVTSAQDHAGPVALDPAELPVLCVLPGHAFPPRRETEFLVLPHDRGPRGARNIRRQPAGEMPEPNRRPRQQARIACN